VKTFGTVLSICDTRTRPAALVLTFPILCLALLVLPPGAQAQSFQVLHSFSGSSDGLQPYGGLTIDPAGRLYGTTLGADNCSPACGTVYRLAYRGSGWIFNTLYQFYDPTRGTSPASAVTIGPDGSLYGPAGGGLINGFCPEGCGVIFRLQPPPAFCETVNCSWIESVVYSFQGCPNSFAGSGQVAFDTAGNIYGATPEGGDGCQGGSSPGGVYQLSHTGGNWNFQILYVFAGGYHDGCVPLGNVVVDRSGNIFGTTYECGSYFGAGIVYEVSPSGSNWIESVLYPFGEIPHDGGEPFTGLTPDSAGNLFGVTPYGGANGAGEVFELSPSNGGYTYSVLYNNFTSTVGPICRLALDSAGNVYGSQYLGGANNDGLVFKLTPGSNGWTFTDLHDFSGTDGQYPIGDLAVDSAGNVYGTTKYGGNNGLGTVWQITP